MNISYWGFNQYIIQRALAAKNIQEAQKGIAFAAFLKLLMPVIVVLPGIAIFVLNPTLATPDHAYPEAMAMLPSGIKGLVFAALLAAIVSSLASMTNSISTIFTVDIYASFSSKKDENGKQHVGRKVQPLEHFLRHPMAKKAKLNRVEVMGLRFYTGPAVCSQKVCILFQVEPERSQSSLTEDFL